MSTRTLGLDDVLHQYLLDVSVDEDPVVKALRVRTATLEEHYMQISPEQGQFFKLLLKLMNAQQVIEVGTYTGYSALCMAQAVGARGRVVCCDISEEWTAIGARILGAGWSRGADRPALGSSARNPGADASGRGNRVLRFCLHRCRQGKLPGVLRASAGFDPARRG